MTPKEASKITAWLAARGYIYRLGQDMSGIMVNTNYYGQYPSDATYKAHSEINAYVRRFYPNLQTEERGFYTGLWIW